MDHVESTRPAETSMKEQLAHNRQQRAAQGAGRSSVAGSSSLANVPMTVPTDRKGKARVTDNNNGDENPVLPSREQSGLFVTPAPISSAAPKRSSEVLLAGMETQRPATKRARLDGARPTQSPTRNSNVLPSIEDQGGNQRRRADHPGRDTVELEPELRNAEGQHGSRSVPTVGPQPDQSETGDDDDLVFVAANPLVHLSMAKIHAAAEQLGNVVRKRCSSECDLLAEQLADRSDLQGHSLHLVFLGAARAFDTPSKSNSLAKVQHLVKTNVKPFLKRAKGIIDKELSEYTKFLGVTLRNKIAISNIKNTEVARSNENLVAMKKGQKFFDGLLQDLDEKTNDLLSEEFST